MLDRLISRRYIGLLLVTAAILAAYFHDPAAPGFPVLASTLGTAYGIYVAGQSATDWKKAHAAQVGQS